MFFCFLFFLFYVRELAIYLGIVFELKVNSWLRASVWFNIYFESSTRTTVRFSDRSRVSFRANGKVLDRLELELAPYFWLRLLLKPAWSLV